MGDREFIDKCAEDIEGYEDEVSACRDCGALAGKVKGHDMSQDSVLKPFLAQLKQLMIEHLVVSIDVSWNGPWDKTPE